MKVKLLYKTPKLTIPTYTFEVTGISTKTLMALSRHQSIQLTVQSSRYTMLKSFKNEVSNENLLTLSKNKSIRDLQVKQINEVRELVKDNPKLKQDELNLLLPQGYKYNLVMTADEQALKHFYSLRNDKSHAHWDIKDLAEKVNYEIKLNKNNENFEKTTPLVVVAKAIRKCYSTENNSDNGGKKDLSLIKRVAITSKHSSVLRHCVIPIKLRKNIGVRYGYITNNNEYIVVNLQELIELYKKNPKEIKPCIPKEYTYLLED